jgi:hypothetical protein
MPMSNLIPLPDGGYAFIKGGFPYCQGVRAQAGYTIERVRFARPLPVAQGFAAIEAYLKSAGRPRTALCAAELRSPKPFSLAGFGSFNEGYVAVLKQWGLFRDGLNPVARSNVAPEIAPPAEPSFYAFCYTVPAPKALAAFVVAGSGEWPSGGKFPDDIVSYGDVSPIGMQAKAHWVLDAMENRLAELGVSWQDVTASQVYTVHDLHAVLRDQIVPRAGNGAGLTWHYCRPPLHELEFEMDVRGVAVERIVAN